MLSKEVLRSKMLKKLRNQKEEEAEKISFKIKEKLFRLKIFKQAKMIMFYLAYRGEVNTSRMIEEAVKLGKKIAVPTCDTKAKKILPCLFAAEESIRLVKGPYCIDEPACKLPVDKHKIDLIIVPGLAFDKDGRRLGRGYGYYDRFLSTVDEHVPKIGLAYKFQVLNRLSCCLPHDVRLDRVIFA